MKFVIILACFIAILCGFLGIEWVNSTQNVAHIAAKCQRRVEETVDPAALQAWAADLLDRYAAGKTNYGGPFPPFPPLAHVWERDAPSTFILGGDSGEESFVCVSWGAAAGHWGLSVGKPTFVPSIPAHGSKMWKPGIYFWQQLH